ncbi:hypothetical protein [Polyangium spumosum]|uniref:Uncharacterized protein n=1 Tax=Polyangium spumosum TaxID=889282 RepID=A0A6N7Q2I2_9BACT|nr:hypothetical protein [Polyangium spumosum]MRG98483.1 hypothetical protein [Polyangium spumosum]
MMYGHLLRRLLEVLDGWSQGVLAGAATNPGRKLAHAIAVADVLSTLIPLVRPELKSTPGAPPDPPEVVLSRVLIVLEGWSLGVLALAGDKHTKTRRERIVAVADVVQVLVGLVQPEVVAMARKSTEP